MELLLPILLILAGLALVLVEVYLIPGLNVVGVAGVIAAGAGVGYAFVNGGAAGGFSVLVGTIIAGATLFALLSRSGAWNRLVLQEGVGRDDADDVARETRARLLGKTGTALSPLRPSGVAEIEGERVEVLTEGSFVAAGSRVRVVAMDRRRYLVRLAEEEPAERGA